MDISERPMPNSKATNQDTYEHFMGHHKVQNLERVYTYLLLKSFRNPDGKEKHRYVKRMTNQEIAKDLGISRNTVGPKITQLIDLGFIQKTKEYYLVPKPDYFELIRVDTLDFLLHYFGAQDKIINLYILMWEYWNAKKSFLISELHKPLGYKLTKDGKPQSRNSAHIRMLLALLKACGLIDFKIVPGRNKQGAAVDKYKVTFISTKPNKEYLESYQRLKNTGEVTAEKENVLKI